MPIGHQRQVPQPSNLGRYGQPNYGISPETLGALSDYARQVEGRFNKLRTQPIATLNAIGQDVNKQLQTEQGALDMALNAPVSPLMGLAGVIKNKGGNWLAGSVEEALKGLKRPLGESHNPAMFTPEMLNDPRIAREFDIRQGESALNQFIDKKLTNYVKNQMATPEDPVRALAEQGILHMPDVEQWGRNFVHPSGEHLEKLAKQPMAQAWENATDNMLRVEPASTYQNFGSSNMTAEHPWIQNLAPDTPFYRPKDNTVPINLGFNHLTDELSNALNPEMGLPSHLQLRPQDLDKMGIDQAVRQVAKINDWRAAQKAEADAMKANNAATHVHKEYAENNPKGLRWVELKQPDTLSDDALKLFEGDSRIKKSLGDVPAERGRRLALEDALKYEGDTMGHCVGGYCDDVASGRSKIYSLRDAKGQPHVTVEVRPKGGSDDVGGIDGLINQLSSDEYKQLKDVLGGKDPYSHASPAEVQSAIYSIRPDATPIPSIVQIKGKANKAPNEEYLPFVQDFVKSGQWSDVGDLGNTGLRKAADVFNPMEQEVYKKQGVEIPTWLTLSDIEELNAKWPAPKDSSAASYLVPSAVAGGVAGANYDFGTSPELFAHGGSVQPNKILTANDLRAIIRSLQSGS